MIDDSLAAHNVTCECGYCRLRRGASRGGVTAAARRRERRQRYLDGTMTTGERAAYARVLDKARAAGRRGGKVSGDRARALKLDKAVQAYQAAVGALDATKAEVDATAAGGSSDAT